MSLIPGVQKNELLLGMTIQVVGYEEEEAAIQKISLYLIFWRSNRRFFLLYHKIELSSRIRQTPSLRGFGEMRDPLLAETKFVVYKD
jgi:hypothetical protein